MRYMILGDIHGCLYKLLALDEAIKKADKVIFVGDYIDRGSDPLGVLRYIGELPNAIRLAGNHEWKYVKKIKKGQTVVPKEITTAEFPEFKELLFKAVGERPEFWYKNDFFGVSHAPAGLYQHDWAAIPIDKFAYGWTLPHQKNEMGFPTRVTLEEKYPGEVSMKPVIFGHIHSDKIDMGNNLYCVDRCCGQENGLLGAVVFEDGLLVDTFEV